MRRSLTSLLAVVSLSAVAFAAPPAAAPPPAPAAPGARPQTLAALRAAAIRSDERLLALVADAALDPGLKRIRTYLGYPDAVLSDWGRATNGGVTVNELLDIATDEHESPQVREEAAAAIFSDRAQAQDPELSSGGRKSARPRVKFSLRVVKLLSDPDLVTRSLASKILQSLWPTAREKEIKDFDPRKRETWGNARASWTRFLAS